MPPLGDASEAPRHAWYSDEACYWHDPGLGVGFLPVGPDIQPLREFGVDPDLRRAEGLLRKSAILDSYLCERPRPATDEELLLAHTPDHIAHIEALAAHGGGEAGVYAPIGFHSALAARFAAGACVQAVTEILAGTFQRAYCFVRPPGHHAERDRAMGFCVYNNLGIAAQVALRGGAQRVLILDWDVHHGNGIQSLFYDDPRVLFISIHQEGLFPPLSGAVREIGEGDGLGTTINVPLPAGSGHAAYLAVMSEVVATAASAFRPELVLVAAGLDLSAHDQMGRQLCTSRTLRLMTQHICQLADELCGGRIVFAHEGGYSSWYLPILVRAVAAAIVGLPEQGDPFLHALANLPGQRLQEHQRHRIEQVRAVHRAHLLAAGEAGPTSRTHEVSSP